MVKWYLCHCDLHCFSVQMMLGIFSYVAGHLCIIFGEMSFQVLGPVCVWVFTGCFVLVDSTASASFHFHFCVFQYLLILPLLIFPVISFLQLFALLLSLLFSHPPSAASVSASPSSCASPFGTWWLLSWLCFHFCFPGPHYLLILFLFLMILSLFLLCPMLLHYAVVSFFADSAFTYAFPLCLRFVPLSADSASASPWSRASPFFN